MSKATRREREIERTKEDILDAAARVFARAGYRGATMAEIAKEAGYSAPSLYSYFKGKKAIVVGLVHLVLGKTLEVFDEPMPQGLTFHQSLELLLQRALGLCEHRRDALTALFGVSQMGPPPFTENSPDVDSLIARTGTWLGQHGKDHLGDLTEEQGADFLFGIVHAFYVRWLRSGNPGKLTDLVPLVLKLFLGGIGGCSSNQHKETP